MLRFLAFFAVFIHHGIYRIAPVLSICGGFGLCLFFFLSAFLITELLQREKDITGSIAIRDFYVRRVLRIWPLYFGSIVLAIVIGIVVPSYHAPIPFVLSYVLMFGNLYIARYGFPGTVADYLWSISIEEQFYLLWPLLNVWLRGRQLVTLLLAVPLVSAGTILVLAYFHATPARGMWTNSLVQLQVFALGALTAMALKGRIPAFSAQIRLALAIAASVCWWLAADLSGIDDRVPRGGYGPIMGYWGVSVGCALFLLSALGLEIRVIPKSLIYLGKISYGLYVFHQLALEMASYCMNHILGLRSGTSHIAYGIGHLGIGLGITIVMAWVSYQYFEMPFLHWKESFTIVRSRTV
jgi:peptidoglycan/LPS O-acetylase OafA/YrhL